MSMNEGQVVNREISKQDGVGSGVASRSPLKIGDTVIYRARPSERFNGATEHPAIVTRVWSPTCVNLKVLPDCGSPFDATSVYVGDPGGYCTPK